MKTLSRLSALLLTAALLLPAGAQAAPRTFSDLPASHWAYDEMSQAVELGVITGYDDGSIHPDDTLTWGQYLVMLVRAFYPETYASLIANGVNWDQAGYWAALGEGLLLEGDFLPVTPETLAAPILRADAAVLLARVLPEDAHGYRGWYYWDWGEPLPADEAFSDYAALGAPYQVALTRLYDAGIVYGRDDGTFGGGETIKRSDGSVLLIRVIDAEESSHYGEETTVTIHITDRQGDPLAPDQVVETEVGESVWYLVDDEELLPRYVCLSDYEQVTTRKSEYTLVYRPFTRAENDQADFEEAVERGEASWDDYYDQPFWLWFQGENDQKCTLLFGDPAKRRYDNQTEAYAHMTTVTIPVWHLDRQGNKVPATTDLVINAAIAGDVVAIFTEIYNDPEQFPIHDVGGYSWRGDSATGEHNCGTAIDINAAENYQVRDGKAMVGSYWKPGEDPYSMPSDGSVVRIFAEHGWSWGGDAWAWDDDPNSGYHDYMHLSYMGG